MCEYKIALVVAYYFVYLILCTCSTYRVFAVVHPRVIFLPWIAQPIDSDIIKVWEVRGIYLTPSTLLERGWCMYISVECIY